MVNVDKVSKYIDVHLEQHISKLQDFLLQPSVSAENYRVRECAEISKGYLADLGCKDARLIETGSFPVVYGEYDAHAPDEFFVVEENERVSGLAGCEKSFVVILDTYAEYGF